MTTLQLSSAYREAIKVALGLQLVTTTLLLLVLDGGTMAKAGGAAMAGFWIGVAIVMIRRPRKPSSLDLIYVRWGYILMLIVSIACLPFMGALHG